MARSTGGEVEHVVAHDAVLALEVVAVLVGSAAQQLGDRGRDVDQPPGARGTSPSLRTPLPAITNGARAWTMPSDAVLTAVAALVLPVVRGGVQDAEVGRRRMVEQLRDVVERVRVRVGGARRVRVGALGVEPHETIGRLVGDRVGTGPAGALVPVGPGAGAPERHRPVGARDFVGATHIGARLDPPRHHVDDRRQLRVEQHVERTVEVTHARKRYFHPGCVTRRR